MFNYKFESNLIADYTQKLDKKKGSLILFSQLIRETIMFYQLFSNRQGKAQFLLHKCISMNKTNDISDALDGWLFFSTSHHSLKSDRINSPYFPSTL